MTEYYPTLKEVLDLLGEDALLVGSATVKPFQDCKDYDFVISLSGLQKLEHFRYWLYEEAEQWFQYIPLDANQKAVDFFYGIHEIYDTSKFDKRLTYEQACLRELRVVELEGVNVLSL